MSTSRHRRARAVVLAAAALLALLPTAPAVAAPEPSAASLRPAVLAPAWAPHVPGATRFDGRIPASVRQVVVVSATRWSSTWGRLTLYTRSGSGWRRIVTWPARLGGGGLVVGTSRRQDTGTTPAGAYSITSAFGRLANPGTSVPYTRVGWDHWWVEDRRSAYYNQMRLGSRGGFALRTTGYNSSERLAAMGAQYDYAAVVNFNRPHPVVGRGAGIFLHAYGTGATGGCIAIRHDRMRATMRWLAAAQHPWIIIGPASWLAA